MYSNSGTGGGKKQRPTTGYLVRPRLGALRSLYSSRPFSAYSSDKRRKLKKSALPKMDFRRKPDYADTAYREAVGRLRILLAESYAPIKRPIRELDSAGEETDNQSLISAGSRTPRLGRSYYHYAPITPRKYHYYPPIRSNYNILSTETEKQLPDTTKLENNSAPPELMSFIERQEEYIEQLEKESRFCKEELSSLLSKVKDVISENENLHEKQKSKLIKSVFDHLETETETETETDNKNILRSPKKSKKTRIIDGPSIVFESRISELEAQLTQARIDLKKAHDENDSYKRKINDGTILEGVGYEAYKKQIDNLQREKETLQETVTKLQNTLALLRDKENDTTDKVKRSLDVAEQAQYEKNAADSEIRRLKDELERQHLKLRDAIAEQSRRISDERSAVERRYTQQIEQLTTELGVQWESTNKLQMEVDKQRRENGDLRREVTQKQALIDELKKDMQSKIITLQTDIGVTGAEKSALEQQIATLQMANERSERQLKQENARLHAEIQSLRQRLDRADADLIHSRRENIRLTEQVASLEKEIALNAAVSEERAKTPRSGEIVALPPPVPKKDDRDKELSSMNSLIQDMENKHAATVAELESMIYSQNQLMDKLSTECHLLTKKLDDTNGKHKAEIRELQTSLEFLNNRFSQSQLSTPQVKDEEIVPTGIIRTAQQAFKNQLQKKRASLTRRNSNISIKPATASRQSSQDRLKNAALPPQQPQQASKSNLKHAPSKEKLASEISSKEDVPPKVSSSSSKEQQSAKAKQQQQLTDSSDQQYQSNKRAQESHSPTNLRTQEYYDPNARTQEQHDPNVRIQEKYDPSTRSQEKYEPTKRTQEQYEPTTRTQEKYEPTIPAQEKYNPPMRTQEQYEPTVRTPQPQDPNLRVQEKYDSSFRSQEQYDPSVRAQEQYSPTMRTQEHDTNVRPQEYESKMHTQEQYNPNVQYDPNIRTQEKYDPNQSYSPNARTPDPYDPNMHTQQQYDPNLQTQSQYDPNMQYDPNQHYNPNQEYDPNQQYNPNQHYNPNQQYDSNQHYDPNQEYDPNQQMEQYEVDPNQQYTTEAKSPIPQYSVDPNIPSSQYADLSRRTSPQYPTDPNLSSGQYSPIDPKHQNLDSSVKQ